MRAGSRGPGLTPTLMALHKDFEPDTLGAAGRRMGHIRPWKRRY